jgi:hypothetical protein
MKAAMVQALYQLALLGGLLAFWNFPALAEDPKKVGQISLHRQTKIFKLIDDLPRIGSDFTLYIRNPTNFVSVWKNTPGSRPSHVEVFVWCTTTMMLVLGFFVIIFKCTPIELVHRTIKQNKLDTAKEPPDKKRAYPRLVGIGFKEIEVYRSSEGEIIGAGSAVSLSPLPGFLFPEGLQKGLDEPQLLILRVGFFHVLVAGVVPSSLGTKAARYLLIVLYSVIAMICLYPPVVLLGASISLSAIFEFSIIIFSFAGLYLFLVITLASICVWTFEKARGFLKLEFPQTTSRPSLIQFLSGFLLAMCWLCLSLGIPVRSILVAYMWFLNFDILRFLIAGILAILISGFINPIIAVPTLITFLYVRKLLEVVH